MIFLARLRNLALGYQRVLARQRSLQQRSGGRNETVSASVYRGSSLTRALGVTLVILIVGTLLLSVALITVGALLGLVLGGTPDQQVDIGIAFIEPFVLLIARSVQFIFCLLVIWLFSLVWSGISSLWFLVSFTPPSSAFLREPDLLTRWWQRCEARELHVSPISFDKGGWRGEYRLARMLLQDRAISGVGIFGYRVGPQSDVDVLLVGPKGVWVLESKYWRGYVLRKEDGSWFQFSPNDGDLGSGRREAPDRQVLRLRKKIIRILQQALPRYSWYDLVHAAVVFTHPQVTVQVEGVPLVFHGTCEEFFQYWHRKPALPGWHDPGLWLRVVDALFAHECQLVGWGYWRGDALGIARELVGG